MRIRELTSDLDAAEAGRLMMAQQVPQILEQGAIICRAAEVTAVHEMRKAIRRTFTSFVLFSSYFEPELIRGYKKGLRRIMRRLARSRDLAVCRIKLAAYNETADHPLHDLEDYWQLQQTQVDDNLTRYLADPTQQNFLAHYADFTQVPGKGVLAKPDPWSVVQVAKVAPALIYERVAAVRAIGENLDTATVAQLHKLRIQFKELRYSLQFFAPLLGAHIDDVLISLEQSQEHLGELNDARIAVELLAKIDHLKTSVEQYQAYQERELQRLVEGYLPVWREFDRPEWRKKLATAVAQL